MQEFSRQRYQVYLSQQLKSFSFFTVLSYHEPNNVGREWSTQLQFCICLLSTDTPVKSDGFASKQAETGQSFKPGSFKPGKQVAMSWPLKLEVMTILKGIHQKSGGGTVLIKVETLCLSYTTSGWGSNVCIIL